MGGDVCVGGAGGSRDGIMVEIGDFVRLDSDCTIYIGTYG